MIHALVDFAAVLIVGQVLAVEFVVDGFSNLDDREGSV